MKQKLVFVRGYIVHRGTYITMKDEGGDKDETNRSQEEDGGHNTNRLEHLFFLHTKVSITRQLHPKPGLTYKLQLLEEL